jgi:DNA-binding NtrC family response regulator
MRQGAFGYILAPFQPGEAGIMVQRALEWRDAESAPDAGAAPARIEDAEARLILATLRQCKNNRTEAARRLGIGRNTLWRKLKRIRDPAVGR